jgi:hypothetical protein
MRVRIPPVQMHVSLLVSICVACVPVYLCAYVRV